MNLVRMLGPYCCVYTDSLRQMRCGYSCDWLVYKLTVVGHFVVASGATFSVLSVNTFARMCTYLII